MIEWKNQHKGNMNMEALTCVGRSGCMYWVSPVKPELWNGKSFKYECTAVHSSLKSQKRHTSFSPPIMSSAAETNPILNNDPASPNTEDTAITQNLIPTQPLTSLSGDSATIDLTPNHNPPAYSLISSSSHDEKLAADIAYHSSPNQMEFWNHTLQTSC